MNLILHIGLPKTGTTTIQHNFLKGEPGYIGKVGKFDEFISKESTHFFNFHRFMNCEDVKNKTREWVERVLFEKNDMENLESLGAIKVSQEAWSRWPSKNSNFYKYPIGAREAKYKSRSRPAPIAEFIKKYLVPEWKYAAGPESKVKIVVTLRNQVEWLASGYSQRSGSRFNASQSDFEKQINSLIEAGDPFLDWDKMLEELEVAVGSENVTALLFEDMGNISFWEYFGRSMEVSSIPACSLADLSISSRKNVRKVSEKTWPIRPLNSRVLWSSILEMLPEAFPGRRYIVGGTRKILNPLVGPLFCKVFDARREKYIIVTDDVSSYIRKYCFKSNQRLAQRLNRDLSTLGY
ncbi:MAG: sulfotransferase domain-containing protein [Pseudomonadota bacterium]